MRPLPALLGVTLVIVGALAPDATHAWAISGARLSVLFPDQQAVAVCNASDSVTERPPDDPRASSFASPGATWYANADRTFWAWWWGRRSVGDYKVLWVRPRGERLRVVGRRLDGESTPVTVDLPTWDSATFITSAIRFPAPGCWHVRATAGSTELEFVVGIP